MLWKCRTRNGFTLIELLLVVAVMAVLAGLVLPSSSPGAYDQLLSAARIIAGDLNFARSLAVTDAANYKVSFDTSANRYILTRSDGGKLPKMPFESPQDTATRHVVDLDELPNMGSAVQLLGARRSGSPVAEVEFNELGSTTQSGETEIWLGVNTGKEKRYISIKINPVTGLTAIGEYTAVAPASLSQTSLNH